MSAPTAVIPGRRPLLRRWSRVSPVVGVAAGLLTLVVAGALLAPWLAPHDPNAVDLLDSYSAITSSHPLGTDDSGRDLLSRLLYGARLSLLGPALVIVLSTTAGVGVALLAAWRGGWLDHVVSGALEIVFAFPGLILAVIAVALFGPGLWAPVLALSVAYVPIVARIVRAVAARERQLPYIAALQVQGVSTARIVVRHLLPNLAPLILVQSAIGYAYAMLDLAAISFLGLGLQPPTADWGVMISAGQSAVVEGYPEQSLYAAAAVLVTVVSLNVVSGWLADRYDVAGVEA